MTKLRSVLSVAIYDALVTYGQMTTTELTALLWQKVPAEKAIRKAEDRRRRATNAPAERRRGDTHSIVTQRAGARVVIANRLDWLARYGVLERSGDAWRIANGTASDAD
jgi:hypothetical protein